MQVCSAAEGLLATSTINNFHTIAVNNPPSISQSTRFHPFTYCFQDSCVFKFMFLSGAAKFSHGLLFSKSELHRELGDIQQHGRPDRLGRHDNEKQMCL